MKLDPSLREAIDDARAQAYTTRRVTVDALEEKLYEPIHVLDHGFVRCVDYMGDDAAIVQAARVSYGKGTKAVRDQAALQDAHLRGAAVDSAPHRQRQRVQRPLQRAGP